MTDEELSKLIGEFLPYPSKDQHYALRSFARIVAAAEREACAKVCIKIIEVAEQDLVSEEGDVQKAMLRGVISGVDECFDAIRARGLAQLNTAAEANGEEL